jgi:hypothetical protein
MHPFSLPRTTVAARLVLTTGEPNMGTVFIMDRVPTHDGPESVLEMLNRPDAFFAFRPDSGSLLLVAKTHTVAVSVAGAPIGDPARLSAAQSVEMELMLEGGSTISGRAQFELPDGHRRVLDYLNSGGGLPFFAVSQGGTTHYVNRAHVLYARPAD